MANKKKVDADEVHETVERHSKMFRDLMLGFVRVHVLHHASQGEIYGSGISEELAHHGYRLSWGTLYPLLHNLTDEGFLEKTDRVVNGKVRKYYAITPLGRSALKVARLKVLELVHEIVGEDEGGLRKPASNRANGRPPRLTAAQSVGSKVGAGKSQQPSTRSDTAVPTRRKASAKSSRSGQSPSKRGVRE
jgi:DNA-binding PadR family transcriptional regulator